MLNRISLRPKARKKYSDVFNVDHIVRIEDNTKNGNSTCIIHLITGDKVEVQENVMEVLEQIGEEEHQRMLERLEEAMINRSEAI